MSLTKEEQFPRKPYTGSCHCGHIKYIIYLSLPILPYPKTTPKEFIKQSGHRIYKCNCTICQKGSIFHIRPLDPANDFFIITPKDPMSKGSGFKQYIPKNASTPWPFCETCGTRPFALRGKGYNSEVELPTRLLQRLESRTCDGTTGELTANEDELTKVQVWRPNKDWKENNDFEQEEENEGGENYLSINAVTLDNHNENLDLRQLHENGYISYMQTLQWIGYDYEQKPYFGGMY